MDNVIDKKIKQDEIIKILEETFQEVTKGISKGSDIYLLFDGFAGIVRCKLMQLPTVKLSITNKNEVVDTIDIINRHDAIKAVENHKQVMHDKFVRKYGNDGDLLYVLAHDHIEDLLLNRISAIPSRSYWTPCSEDLPEINKEVMISLDETYDDGDSVTVGWRCADDTWAIYAGGAYLPLDAVLAWAEKPGRYEV